MRIKALIIRLISTIKRAFQKPDSVDVQNLCQSLQEIQVKFPHWHNTQKIAAILALSREYGLADAKFIVEHPEEAVANLRARGIIQSSDILQ